MLGAILLILPALADCYDTNTYHGIQGGLVAENMTDQLVKLQENRALLQDFEKNGDLASCTGDWTHKMPVCYQICNEWCWTTGVAMVTDYYKGSGSCSKTGESGGFECKIASHEFNQQCCPYNTNSCNGTEHERPKGTCDRGGQKSQVLDAAQYFTGGKFNASGPLSQARLDSLLHSGSPVMIGTFWTRGGGHLLTIGGCANGKYFVHDPWRWYGDEGFKQPPDWQSLTYDQVLKYQSPNPKLLGNWLWSFARIDEQVVV